MKRTFFERLTGTISMRDRSDEEAVEVDEYQALPQTITEEASNAEGELAVDVYQTNDMIMVRAMVAGVSLEDLSVSITREMIIIKGKREEPRGSITENYVCQELYWGNFSRTILLPVEIETEEAEATEKHGLLTIKLPKIDKGRTQVVKIRSL